MLLTVVLNETIEKKPQSKADSSREKSNPEMGSRQNCFLRTRTFFSFFSLLPTSWYVFRGFVALGLCNIRRHPTHE